MIQNCITWHSCEIYNVKKAKEMEKMDSTVWLAQEALTPAEPF